MNLNLIMFLFAILILLIGAGVGLGISYLAQRGKNPTALLATADTVIDGVVTTNNMIGKALIPAPVESIISKILNTAQIGVHAAQQLYNSDQLSEDQRKQKAFDATINLLKLEGFTTTPELEVAVKDAIEAGVFVVKNAYWNVPAQTVAASPIGVVPAETETESTSDPSTQLISITKVIQQTLEQVGDQAKTQAIDNLTQQFADIVQKVTIPQSVPGQSA